MRPLNSFLTMFHTQALDYCYEKLLLEGFLNNSQVGPGPFFDTKHFPELKVFEERWEEIRDEVIALREHSRLPLLQVSRNSTDLE